MHVSIPLAQLGLAIFNLVSCKNFKRYSVYGTRECPTTSILHEETIDQSIVAAQWLAIQQINNTNLLLNIKVEIISYDSVETLHIIHTQHQRHHTHFAVILDILWSSLSSIVSSKTSQYKYFCHIIPCDALQAQTFNCNTFLSSNHHYNPFINPTNTITVINFNTYITSNISTSNFTTKLSLSLYFLYVFCSTITSFTPLFWHFTIPYIFYVVNCLETNL